MKKIILVLCATLPALAPQSLSGQAVTNTLQKSTIEELRRLERAGDTVKPEGPVLDQGEPTEAQKTEEAARRRIETMPDTGVTVTITTVKFSESSVFSPAELDAFAADILNKPVRMADLFAVTGAINAEYAARGYPINIANIPPQKIKDGLLEIQLVEARLGAVIVEGNDGLSEDYVQRHVRLAPDTPVHVDTLEQKLVHFNKTNRAAIVSELKAGERVGTTDLIARVVEPPRVEAFVSGDNAGRKNTGLYRGTAMIRGYSWLSSGDSPTLAGVFSEGTRTAYGSYEVPVDSWGTALGGSYSYGETEVISGPFEMLDITGVSHTGDAYVSVPIVSTNNFFLKTIIHGTYYHSTTDFVNVLTDKEETYGGTLGFDAELLDSGGRWLGYFEFRGGRANLGASSAVPDPREGDFYKFSGNFGRVQRFNDIFSAYATVGGQASLADRLASSEQFQLGGVATVRGYPEGLLLGDHGYFARGELWANLPRSDSEDLWGFISRTFSVFTFVDHGGVFPYKGHEIGREDSDFLTSAGAGIAFNWRNIITAQFTYAKPLQDVPYGQDESNFLFRVGCRLSW